MSTQSRTAKPDAISLALGPGEILQKLSGFVSNLHNARQVFADLLVSPYLENISVDTGDKKRVDLSEIVNGGSTRLHTLVEFNIGLARNAIAYNDNLKLLVDGFTVQEIVESMRVIATGYADQAASQFGGNKAFFEELASYINRIDEQVHKMDVKLADLNKSIGDKSKAIEGKDIISILSGVLENVYKLATESDEAKIQVTKLLGVATKDIAGDFGSLFEDAERSDRVQEGLRDVHSKISVLRVLFAKLANILGKVTGDTEALVGVWGDVADRMQDIAKHTDNIQPRVRDVLKSAWGETGQNAQSYIKAVSEALLKDLSERAPVTPAAHSYP